MDIAKGANIDRTINLDDFFLKARMTSCDGFYRGKDVMTIYTLKYNDKHYYMRTANRQIEELRCIE